MTTSKIYPGHPPPCKANLKGLVFAIFLIAQCACVSWAAAPKYAKKVVAAKSTPQAGPQYAGRTDAMQFAEDMAARRDLDPAWVKDAIGNAR